MKYLKARTTCLAIALLVATIASAHGGTVTDAGTEECFAWIEQTYGIESMMRELNLDLAADYERIRACVARDARILGPEKAVKYCDNVFKVHCSSLDLLTEIGEAQIRSCENLLGEPLPSCAQDAIFDRYSLKGETTTGRTACQAVLDACSTKTSSQSTDTPPTAQPSAAASPADAVSVAWSQWGGPSGDFSAPAAGLAESWPEDGPAKLWSRALGDGYSAIVAEGGRLYTMHRVGDEEAVVCLDAATGETIWEHRYEHSPHEKHVRAFGEGPSSTPLVAAGRLFTVGIAGRMHALRKDDGKVVWSRSLWDEELAGNLLIHGYSSSPVAYQDTVIVPVGGEDAGLVAFRQSDGSVKWKTRGFRNSYSSPRVVDVAGEPQLVAFMAEELIGVDPEDGAVRWRYPHVNQWNHNISPPSVANGDTVFLSSPQAGARGLRLIGGGETIEIEELWSNRRVQFYHGSSVRIGDWVYGSTGTATAFMTGVNIRTGEVAWRERGFAKANCVEADGKLVILDEDGMLYLASATPEKLVVHSKTQLLGAAAWTVPTIVGTTLYVRDRRQIVAVDLG